MYELLLYKLYGLADQEGLELHSDSYRPGQGCRYSRGGICVVDGEDLGRIGKEVIGLTEERAKLLLVAARLFSKKGCLG